MGGCALTDAIRYIGVNDTTIDLFESQYEVLDGISYNSYVILDEKIAVMDSVDKRGVKEWFANLDEVLEGRSPDYLVVNHLEPDHAGNIQVFLERYPEAQMVTNEKTFKMFPQFFTIDVGKRSIMIAEGDELALGKHILTFVMASMVHWPEVMVTYEKTEKILFSADAFGKFGALDDAVEEDDEISSSDNDKRMLEWSAVEGLQADWLSEARRYYTNIVGKYGVQVQALLKKVAALDIRMICPLHGPMLTENIPFYLEKYHTWSSYLPEEEGIVIAHASIHGNTTAVAKGLATLLEEKGVSKVAVYDLARDDMSQVVAEAFRYSKLVVACATYDGGLFPCMESFLYKLKSKNYQKRTVGIIENGSWGPVAGRLMKESFATMKEIKVLEPMVTVHSTLSEQSREQLAQLVEQIVLE